MIDDIYKCNTCPNERKGEFGNVENITTIIINDCL